MAKSKIARSAANMAAKKAAGKTVAKAVGKKAFPAYVAYEGAKEIGAGIKSKSLSKIASGAAGMTLLGTAAIEAKGAANRLSTMNKEDRTVNGDRGVNPKEPVDSYNKRMKREAATRSQSRKRG